MRFLFSMAVLTAAAASTACSNQAQTDTGADSAAVSTHPGDTTSHADSSRPGAAPDTLRRVDTGAQQLLPTDQADASFRQFRQEFLAALARRDTAYLYKVLLPTIRTSFGPDNGIAGFKRQWRPDSADSRVWSTLTRMLELGGKLEGNRFIAPYVFAFWPEKFDSFENVAVIEKNAPVYASKDAADPIGSASYSILKRLYQPNEGVRVRVQLPSGDTAFIKESHVYSPVGWRGFFEKQNGEWRMTLFVAGD